MGQWLGKGADDLGLRCHAVPRYQHELSCGLHGRCLGDVWCGNWPSVWIQHLNNIETVLRSAATKPP